MPEVTSGVDRNGLGIIEPGECWLLLRHGHIGRLAVDVGGRPDIFPVNYVVDGESIVILTAPGSKLAGAVLGGTVAFEIDAADPLFHTGWSVVAKGRAELIEDLDGQLRAEELPLRPWGPGPKHDYLRIVVDSVSGRRILPAHG